MRRIFNWKKEILFIALISLYFLPLGCTGKKNEKGKKEKEEIEKKSKAKGEDSPSDSSSKSLLTLTSRKKGNGYPQLRKALEDLTLSREERKALNPLARGKKDDPQLRDKLLEKYKSSLKSLDQALSYQKIEFPPIKEEEEIFQYLGRQRSLAYLLLLRGRKKFKAGAHQEAYVDLVKLTRLGDFYKKQKGNTFLMLVGVAMQKMALQRIRDNLKDMENSAFLDSLAKELRKYDGYREELKACLEGERERILRKAQKLKEGKNTFRKLRRVPKKIMQNAAQHLDLDATDRLFREHIKRVLSACEGTYQESKEETKKLREHIGLITDQILKIKEGNPPENALGKVIYAMESPATSGLVNQKFVIQAQFRATWLFIGLRRYQLARGRLADQLSDLAPDFIKEVPFDPYHGRDFGYKPSQKVLYSHLRKALSGGRKGSKRWKRHTYEIGF